MPTPVLPVARNQPRPTDQIHSRTYASRTELDDWSDILALLKLEEVAAVSQLKVSVPDRIREGLDKDPIAKGLMDLAREG